MAVMQIARETEQLHAHPHRIGVEACGAIWQAFSGTAESNACHTCPTHLLLDGQHPTLITKNRGLRRCMIVEFADCVLMRREINEIDIVVDDLVGRSAFVDATELVLNEAGTTWHDGLELFTKHARELLAPVQEILFNPTAGRFLADERADGVRLDALSAYDEGIFLTVLNPNEIEVFAGRVRAEMNIP